MTQQELSRLDLYTRQLRYFMQTTAGVRRAVWPVLILGFICLGGQAMAAVLFGAPANHLSRMPEADLLSPVWLEGWVVGPPDPDLIPHILVLDGQGSLLGNRGDG